MSITNCMQGLLALLFCACMAVEPALANTHTKPDSPAVLSFMVTKGGDAERKISLDIDTLRSFGETSFTTHTIWTEGEQVFTGVRLADFLRHFDITSGTIRVSAINDYSVEFPVSEALSNDALIAYARNGETMSVRDKGPLWIVYPYDDNKRYQSEVYYSRSIWQLTRIDILE